MLSHFHKGPTGNVFPFYNALVSQCGSSTSYAPKDIRDLTDGQRSRGDQCMT